jgi:AraC family ethanolamine operon transcriptional activator
MAAAQGTEDNSKADQKIKALKRALNHLAERLGEPLSVGELCRATRVSERTLRRAFLEKFEMPPKAYLKALRLLGAREELQTDRSSSVTITDVANHWGFWHMGQFAADYRRIYNELPSATLTRR